LAQAHVFKLHPTKGIMQLCDEHDPSEQVPLQNAPNQDDMLVSAKNPRSASIPNFGLGEVNPRCVAMGCFALAASAGVGFALAKASEAKGTPGQTANIDANVKLPEVTAKPITIVMLGHVASGKSTVLGHMMQYANAVTQADIDNNETEAKKIGKGAFKYAWVCDKIPASRKRGITIDTSENYAKFGDYNATILDTPGHRDFIRKVSHSCACADVGVLVVAASTGEFEAGISSNGQTREHTLLAYAHGIKQLIVVVNKMDSTEPPYSESRFNEIQKYLSSYCKKVGFDQKACAFIPVSGFHGDNLKDPSKNMPWFKESAIERKIGGSVVKSVVKTLDGALQGCLPPERDPDGNLLMEVRHVYNVPDVGVIPAGKILQGTLKKDMALRLLGGGHSGEKNEGTGPDPPVEATALSIRANSDDNTVDSAAAGDYVTVKLPASVKFADIRSGMVLSSQEAKLPARVKSMVAKVIVLNHPGEIHKGYEPIVDVGTRSVSMKFAELREKIDKRSGKLLEKNPRMIKSGDAAMVLLAANPDEKGWHVFGLPLYADTKMLRRFAIRDKRETVAVGTIKSVEYY